MSWNVIEIEQACDIVAEIQEFSVSRTTELSQRCLTLSPGDAADLQNGLRCQTPGLVVRHLLRLLMFDESHLFRWRLEHKLVQALLIHHYCPGSFPPTQGFAREFSLMSEADRREKLHTLVTNGNLVKPSLGYGSGERNAAEQSEAALEILTHTIGAPRDLTAENFVIQERISIAREYRVNTMEDQVIPGLTFHRYDFGEVTAAERKTAENYVQTVLDQLPDAMVHGSLLAWDVARTREGRFIIIEINLTGFHPVFERGFHCTGLFSDPAYAAAMTGKLLSFVERRYQVDIDVHINGLDNSEEAQSYVWAGRWKELCNIARCVAEFEERYRFNGVPESRKHTKLFGTNTFHFIASKLFDSTRLLNDLSLISEALPLYQGEVSTSTDLTGLWNQSTDPAVTLPKSPKTGFTGPRTPIEVAVAAIWSEALEIVDPGVDDDFLQLGGDSVTAIRVIARIRREFGIEFPLPWFFESSWTLAGMSAAIDDFISTKTAEQIGHIPSRNTKG